MIKKQRLEAFSDGVLAIIITIMILEMKIPHTGEISALISLIPVFVSYVLSFIYVGIYWNNHHHMLHAVESVNGKVLWANLHLLFWLSLIPFVTGWMGENHFSKWPVVFYGIVLIMNAVAYTILTKALLNHHKKDSLLSKAVGNDLKGKISVIASAFINSWIGLALYFVVAAIWLVPDKRIENKMKQDEAEKLV